MLALALAPVLGAVWLAPGFVTQDGPAHVYNAHILLNSLRTDSPFVGTYEVHWTPLPNWAGHLALMGLMSLVPPRTADRAMISLTLAGTAVSVLWLRWRVRGDTGLPAAALWAALLGMNLTWLFGFYSFLLGVCLFAITLGAWWTWREALGSSRTVVLAALLVAGYFCHPISLGGTVLGLALLALIGPAAGRARRCAWTLASFLPLIPLGMAYRRLMHGGGRLEPEWGVLGQRLFSPLAWKEHLGWVDPLTLGSRFTAPFLEGESSLYLLAAPVLWFVVGAVLLAFETARNGSGLKPVRGWTVVALLLVLGGSLAPDTFGPAHGNYLAQRLVLLGLAAALPALELEGGRRMTQVAVSCLAMATLLQGAFVLDYARRADRVVPAFLQARGAVGRGERIGTLLVDVRGRYRANPLLHLDSLLGVGTGNTIWSNYESAFYYFPVRVRPDINAPPVSEFEWIAKLDAPWEAAEKARRWKELLERYQDQIDVLVVWGDDRGFRDIHEPLYEVVSSNDRLHVLRRRGRP